MGLSLVKSLVELHGGRVQAISTPGQGSTFTVVLPMQAAAGADADVRADADTAGEERPLSILLVDDNVDAAVMLAYGLRSAGHTVTVKHDASSALSHARASAPDVFVLDVGLPDLDGYELARQLRQLPTSAAATFIALTGYGQQRDRLKSKEAGFDHHLVKPIEKHQLTQLLTQAGNRTD